MILEDQATVLIPGCRAAWPCSLFLCCLSCCQTLRFCLKTQYLASSGSFALWLRPAPSPDLQIWLLRRPCQRPKQLALGPTVAFSDRTLAVSCETGRRLGSGFRESPDPGWPLRLAEFPPRGNDHTEARRHGEEASCCKEPPWSTKLSPLSNCPTSVSPSSV